MGDSKKNKTKRKLSTDMLNVIIGIVVLLFILLYSVFPQNKVIFLIGVMVVGAINIATGLSVYRQNRKQGIGMSYILIGGIIIAIGLYEVVIG